jgi:hypothetical protein
MILTKEEEAMASGKFGPGIAKCMNILGNFDINPGVWTSLKKNGRIKKYSINNPRTGKSIEFKKEPSLKPYLKKWARLK